MDILKKKSLCYYNYRFTTKETRKKEAMDGNLTMLSRTVTD